MDKVCYAGDLSQEDAPDFLKAFPEEEPIVDDENFEPSQLGEQPNTSKQTLPETKSRDKKMNNSSSVQHKQFPTRKSNRNHRYVQRQR